jgi:hypothetical protein
MSEQIIGKKIKMRDDWKVYGNYPSYSYDIDPRNVSALEGQRDTESKTLIKYIKDCGGMDLSMTDPITIGYFPEDYIPDENTKDLHYYGYCPEVEENRWMALLDGDHRRHLHILFDLKKIPCAYVAVESKEKYSEAYVKRNSTLRKKQNAEEIFIMEALASLPHAISTIEELKICKLHVDGGSGQGCKQGFTKGPSTKIKAFTKGRDKLARRGFGIKYLQSASEMIQQVYPNDKSIHADLLLGLSIFLSEYDNLPNNVTVWTPLMTSDFDAWLKKRSMKDQKSLAKTLSNIPGAVVNYIPESVALGMAMEYRTENAGGLKVSTKKKKMNESVIKKLIKRKS